MLTNTLRTRGVVFAYLFGPPRFVQREEASTVHGKICDRLGYDDISFQYSTPSPDTKPSSKGFLMRFERREGRGTFQALVDYEGASKPMRLLMSQDWPPAVEHTKELFDLTAAAVFEVFEGNCQRVHAEVRLKAQCDVSEADGLSFLKERILKLPPEQLQELGGALVFASVRFEVAGSASPQDALEGPKRDLTIEVLREDPRGIYLELVSQWFQLPGSMQPEAGIDITRIRPIGQEPSAYIEEAHTFLTKSGLKLGG